LLSAAFLLLLLLLLLPALIRMNVLADGHAQKTTFAAENIQFF
jgi:hypothetical protein